ncbi:fibrocystin isoform 3-T3 [Liasis olivaceus]
MDFLMSFFFKALLLFFAVTLAKFIMEPKAGSLGGGTWITINFDGLSHLVNWSQLQVALLKSELTPVLCDIMPVSVFLSTIKCQTRSSPREGLYHLQLSLNGQSISNVDELHEENCTFQFSVAATPVVFHVNPSYGVPGNVIQIYGLILAQDYETYNFNMDFIDGPVILEAEKDGWITICSLASQQTHSIYPIQLDHGLGTVECQVEGNYIGSHNVSFSVYNKGKSIVHKDAWLISAKQELFLYQTFSDISSVSPAAGSLGGGTDLTITGNFFDTPVKVTAAGTPCQIKHITPQKIICTTGAVDNNRTFSEIQPGNRGLLFEVWDGSDANLTEAIPGYSWQIVPNASSPYNFLSGKQKLFSARLRGFFVAPETNNYTFWIQADGKASLYLSLSDDPRRKVEVVSIPTGTSDWSALWEEDWAYPRKPKSEKYELTGGTMYYLEAVYDGRSPNNGIRVGVQMHNTWLNPDVVSTYRRESYRIQVSAVQLPEIQMLILSGRGWFSLAWDNVTSNLMSTNVTAEQMQKELEELLSVKCEIEPSSANIFLQARFEQNTENLVNGGAIVSWTEPFCGRFSTFRPKSLIKTSQLIPPYDVTKYTHLCFAYKGYLKNTLYIAVSYYNTFLNTVKKHLTCQWNLKSSPESWKFICTNLWRDCLSSSEFLIDLPKNSSVFLHQIDVEAPATGTETPGWFFIDEIIVSDQDVVVFQKEPRSAHSHGNLIESISVAGIPPVFNVSFFVADYHMNLPLLSLRGGMPLEGSEGADRSLMSVNEARINLTVQRIQSASPALGGTFQIHLPNVVIPGIPVSISADHLHSLLQNYSDNFTAQYINANDFSVSKISSNCYQSIWTLTWTSMIGDLPNFIRVSDENLTGLNPAAMSYVVFDGGVFIHPVFGDMLATPNNFTQVVVTVNDIPANCSGSCTFQYLRELTPLVSSIDYSTGDTDHIIVHIIGSGLTADSQSLHVETNNITCKILSSNHTSVLCQMNLLPVGMYRVTLLVRPYGFAINSSGESSIFLKITPRLTSVEPSTASEIGGLPVILSGSGLDGINTVLFGSQLCPINFNASNAMTMECKLPPWSGEESTVHLTLINDHESTVFTNAFTYDPSLNPLIVSMSRNKSGITGGQLLSVVISSFSHHSPLDVKVEIGDAVVEIQTVTEYGLSVVLPSLADGLHRLSVFLHHLPLSTNGFEPLIQYVTDVFRIEPCCGSFLGGTLLTISGTGFSNNSVLVLVLIDSQPCTIINLTEDKILCWTPPPTQPPNTTLKNFLADIEVFIGNRSSVDTFQMKIFKNYTFLYKMSLTPDIINIEIELLNNSLRLGVEGVNVTNSVAILKHVECHLEVQKINHSITCSQCSLPLSVLEPGHYVMRVLQKQVGFANIPTEMQHFRVYPQIKTIFPSHGSVCGGQLLTISGQSLKSWTNSTSVNLTGNFTCEIQSSNDTSIICAIFPSDSLLDDQRLPDVPQALNITVNVNGIHSRCLGECSFHLLGNKTLVIEAVTARFSGILIYLLIRIQKLVWAVNEILIEVDGHLPCNITSLNKTSIECQTGSLDAKEHSISVLSRSWGGACLRQKGSNIFRVTPDVLHLYPQNFSINGGGLLTLEGAALQGRSSTSVLIGNQKCLLTKVTYWILKCLVPSGKGTAIVRLDIDNVPYPAGEISYSEEFTPVFLSLLPATGQFLTIMISKVRQTEDMHVFIGGASCANVTSNGASLQCVLPQLPTGEYNVTGGSVQRGWASSSLVFTSVLTVISVKNSHSNLEGGEVYIHGNGFSPGNTSVAICGSLCEMLNVVTTTDLSCLTGPLNASIAVLCGLTYSVEEDSEDCQRAGAALIQCDIQIKANADVVTAATPFLFLCDDLAYSSLRPNKDSINSSHVHFSALLISPKVERDEVLIYNSSCNITMETEAEMECEGPNQPITAKITEIWKNWGQNTQNTFQIQFCGRWSKNVTWLNGHPPQDGDTVTVERGHILLLDTNTSILNMLHVKGGKLAFIGPGPLELHAHYILVSDGGELQVGSPKKPFCGIAHIHLHGSAYSEEFFPYGAKFLAVRNGTLSMHGCVPKVSVTHLKSAAHPNDTKLDLMDFVDWKPGDEVVVCGGGLEGAQKKDEIVTIKKVNGTELYITPPLRYLYSVTEEQVLEERLAFRAVVALLSRNLVIQGNVTTEKVSHLQLCKAAGISGDNSECLYKRSERKPGSQNMGGIVIVESYYDEESLLCLTGVQFYHVGQASQKHLSALTVAGNAQMTNSYIQHCAVLDSFAQGVSLSGISDFRIENNTFYNIMGHGIKIGEQRGQNNKIRHNTIIGLVGTDGLSNTEILSPAGIYIQAPDNLIESNTVCGTGHGYFFHLPRSRLGEPVMSFSNNVAYSCSRYGLLIHPAYHPQSSTEPVIFQKFSAWKCKGGVKIISTSNFQLWNFHIASCKDFGINIVESLGNTSVVHSVLIGHFHKKQDGSCMLTGLKTPQKRELLISHTTFMNFDSHNCTAITTCSGCYQGQGGFTVRTEQVLFLNAPNWLSFPFPHCAILKDLDGSVTGQQGSQLLPSLDILPDSCRTIVNASQAINASCCFENVTFHRMSIGLKSPIFPSNLTVTDSRNKVTTVNYVSDTLSNANGWMILLLDQQIYTLSFSSPLLQGNLQYIATFDNFTAGNYLLLEHEGLPSHVQVTVLCGKRQGSLLQAFPSHRHHNGCDWFFNRNMKKLTYLVTGNGLIQVTFKIEDTFPLTEADPVPSFSPPIFKWSLAESWNDVTKGWGGYNKTIPSADDDVIILPNRTILVDMNLPPLRGLYIQGTLEFSLNTSHVLSAACIVIAAGGVLKVGTPQHPLEERTKVRILLRASERVNCDRLKGLNIGPGTIGVFGKLQMHSAYTRKSWTHLGNDAAPGNERIMMQDHLDWHQGDSLVVSSSSYEAHQAEIITLEKVNNHSIRIRERLLHRHIGHSHRLEDGRWILLAAEVGLLTRNIQIKSDMDCTGGLLVRPWSCANQDAGVLQLSNVEIFNFGSSQSPSVDITNSSLESFIISSSIHHSCGVGIQATASSGLFLRDNVIFNTIGHGIHLEGHNHTLIRNLVVLSKQPRTSRFWVAGIKTNAVEGVLLHNNSVAGSERIAFHIKGQECFLAEDLCSDNIAHSSLHGIHLYKGDGSPNCTRITGFLSYKNYDYGIMFHLGGSIVVEKVILVDNVVGLLPVLYGPPAKMQCHQEKQHLNLRNSVFVASSTSFDCIKDRIQPLSADLTIADRAPRNPWRGRVGMLWPSFTSDCNWWPDTPWHKIRSYSVVPGIITLQDITFDGFKKSCYTDDQDICIMTNPGHGGILHLITSEQTRMLHISEQNMFYFHPLRTRENESIPDSCGDVICGSSRKALFKDLDGSALGLDSPVSVFPKSLLDWEQPCQDAGIYREERKCILKPSSNIYFCHETDYGMVILESMDTDLDHRNFSPPLLVTSTFVDTFSEATSQGTCCSKELSLVFYSILPSNRLSKICFAGPVPWSLRLYFNGGHGNVSLLLAIFYDEPRSFHVFVKENSIQPVLFFSRLFWENATTGTFYFSFQENLLYVSVPWDKPIEIHTRSALHTAFTIAENTGEKAQAMLLQQLANFLQIGQDEIRTVSNTSGNEDTLRIIADNSTKRKYQCPPKRSCVFTSEQKTQGSLHPSHVILGLRVLILEISDPLHFLKYKVASSFPSVRLKSLASRLIDAQQTGTLQHVLRLPVDTLVVMVSSTSVTAKENSRNGSSPTSQSCLYVRPYSISVWIQPSNGVVERPLLRQPKIIFLDKQGRRIVSLGFPLKPWLVTAYLKNNPDVLLKGNTRVEVQDGQASFQNLIVSSSCSDCRLIFKVTSPPGAALSVESDSFTVSPVAVSEKSAIIFTALLCSIASMLVLGFVVICWLKKSKKNKSVLKQTLKNKKCQTQENQANVGIHQYCVGKENEHSTSVREDLKLCGELTHIEEPLKKLHQETVNSVSAGAANEIKQGHWLNKRKSTRDSLELQELGIKEFNEWKKTKQHIFDYVQYKEMKGEQFVDQKYKRHTEMPMTRSEENMRGKQEVAVS